MKIKLNEEWYIERGNSLFLPVYHYCGTYVLGQFLKSHFDRKSWQCSACKIPLPYEMLIKAAFILNRVREFKHD